MKQQRYLEESRASSAAAIRELENLQNEKRKMLMEHETAKLRELDDSYAQELREWKGQLKPRKQVRPTKNDFLFYTLLLVLQPFILVSLRLMNACVPLCKAIRRRVVS